MAVRSCLVRALSPYGRRLTPGRAGAILRVSNHAAETIGWILRGRASNRTSPTRHTGTAIPLIALTGSYMDKNRFGAVAVKIDGYRDEVIRLQTELCRRQALDPTSGGKGEEEKAS